MDGDAAAAIRVVIVDDHAVVRSGLRHVLEAEDDIEVVAEAGDMRNAVFEARAHKPDVILMDVVMPGESGIEATPAVLKEAPDAKVLVLSMQDDPRYVREAFEAGASGYGFVEGWRGPVFVAVTAASGNRIARCHPHDPSWQNWPALEHAVIGNIVPDFPLINKSFNLSYSGHDL